MTPADDSLTSGAVRAKLRRLVVTPADDSLTSGAVRAMLRRLVDDVS